MDLGHAFKELRFKRKARQGYICNQAGISQTYLSQIENGLKVPSIEVINGLCAIYKVPPAIVFWMATKEQDVQKGKRSIYNELKPHIDNLINAFI